MSTLVSEGALGGRHYAVKRDGGGAPAAYICMTCGSEIALDRDAFLRHGRRAKGSGDYTCAAAEPAAPQAAAPGGGEE